MEDSVKKTYYDTIHLWGRLTLSASVVLFLGIGCYLSFIRGYHPGWDAVLTAFFGVAAMVGHTWVNISDQVLYLLLMGPAATYMAQLTGNVKNMRLPSALAACAALEDGEDRCKRDILATFGVAGSVIVNTSFLILLVMAGRFLIKILPVSMLSSLNYIVPALFGAIFGQFSLKNIPMAVTSLAAVLVVFNITAIPAFLRAFTAIILAIAVNILIYRQKARGTNNKKE